MEFMLGTRLLPDSGLDMVTSNSMYDLLQDYIERELIFVLDACFISKF
jgi:hypothetical protein